jgi:transcriptional regulator with XRE-family HTH domain
MNRALKAKIILNHGSQENFCEHMKVSRSLVSNVIHGRRELPFEKRVLWAVHLKCSLDEIFPEEKDSNP